MPPLLISAALLLTGCAPEEKTLLLPQASLSEDESETVSSEPEFTVRKIYTYSYQTRAELAKSAFLQGCSENEINIISLDAQDYAGRLDCLQVDYRYGFYDTAGCFFETWEDWGNPSGEEMEGDLFIDRLLPSPDGNRMLVYVRSDYLDTLIVWLYTLGAQEPLLLYDGTESTDGPLKGSFSPSGRWVTFDAMGATTGAAHLVPLYDCQKEHTEEEEPWSIPERPCRFHPPDQTLYADTQSNGQLWDAVLYDDGDMAGLISIFQESGSLIGASRISPSDQDIIPDVSLLTNRDSSIFTYSSCYLYGIEGMPYPQYAVSSGGERIDYMGTPSRLWSVDMDTMETHENLLEFPDLVWDFLRLDSGDHLAALVQSTGRDSTDTDSADILARFGYGNAFLSAAILGPFGSGLPHFQVGNPSSGRLPHPSLRNLLLAGNNGEGQEENGANQDYWTGTNLPVSIQAYWDIRSADLYLYREGETEGHLLYKNLQNLIGMEYDAQSRRILLETYEGRDLAQRRCIILEL